MLLKVSFKLTLVYMPPFVWWLKCIELSAIMQNRVFTPFYSVFEKGQWKVKVFQKQYSDLINFISNIENKKDSDNNARTPFVAATSPPPPMQYFKNVVSFFTKKKLLRNVSQNHLIYKGISTQVLISYSLYFESMFVHAKN